LAASRVVGLFPPSSQIGVMIKGQDAGLEQRILIVIYGAKLRQIKRGFGAEMSTESF
jgi:hypothetical protein